MDKIIHHLEKCEDECIRVHRILASPESDRFKLNSLLHLLFKIKGLFAAANTPDDQASPVSSYLFEFSSDLLSLIHEGTLSNHNPGYLSDIYNLIADYRRHADDENERQKVASCLDVTASALVQSWVILGEWEKALQILQVHTQEILNEEDQTAVRERLRTKADASETLSIFQGAFKKKYARSFILCERIAEKWKQDIHSLKPRQIFLTLVEKNAEADSVSENRARLIPAELRITSRLPDTDEDLIRINNEVISFRNQFLHEMHDILSFVRAAIAKKYRIRIQKTHFLIELTIPEKAALYTGSSWSAAFAVLIYSGMINHFFGKNIIQINQNLLITGGMDTEGNLLTVSESSLASKISAIFFSPLQKLVVPWNNLEKATEILSSLQKQYPKRLIHLESVQNFNQVIEDQNILVTRKVSLALKWISQVRHRKYGAKLFLFFLIIILSGVVLFRFFRVQDKNPANFDMAGTHLIITNIKGKELWRKDLTITLNKMNYNRLDKHNVIFVDLDDNDKKEVLFGVFEDDKPDLSGYFYLFDHHGKIVFKNKTGHEYIFNNQKFSDTYRVSAIQPHDFDGDAKQEIITISYHAPSSPCCLMLWDLSGKLLDEYWHFGQLMSMYCIDLDHDGRDEIILGGMNDEYKCPVIVVLKVIDRIALNNGISSKKVLELSEYYYIRFPVSDLYVMTRIRDWIYEVIPWGPNTCRVAVANNIIKDKPGELSENNILYYYLNDSLQVRDLIISDNFIREYFKRTGKELNIERKKRELSRLLYFTKKDRTEEL